MTDHADPAHARLAPSSADGWSICSDYPNANEGLPDDDEEYSAEGTAAHEISDSCLKLGFDAHDFIGTTIKVSKYSFTWTEDDAEMLQIGLDWVRSRGGHQFYECRIDASRWLGPGQFGTFDRGVVLPDLIIINDLKWGRFPVSPVENRQAMIYALSFWDQVARHLTDATEFLIVIDQPRAAGGGGHWRVSLDELLAFGEWIKERAEATRGPNTTRVASLKGCHWCRRRKQRPNQAGALTGCMTYDAFNLATIGAEFDDLDDPKKAYVMPDPKLLTAERRAYIFLHMPMVKTWLDLIEDSLSADAEAGLPVGPLKVVDGRKQPDKWRDAIRAEDAVVSVLGDRGFKKKLITPTQTSKLVTSEAFAEHIAPHVIVGTRPPELVPEADARPPRISADDFDDLF